MAADYVDRQPNPADGRGVLAGITPAGRAVVDKATAALTELDFGSDLEGGLLSNGIGILDVGE